MHQCFYPVSLKPSLHFRFETPNFDAYPVECSGTLMRLRFISKRNIALIISIVALQQQKGKDKTKLFHFS